MVVTVTVEMERTRLRELTPYFNAISVDNSVSRNGAYPIKGIDTSKDSGSEQRFLGRNGAYPIKGIDTRMNASVACSFQPVEMERTRLRELTQSCFLRDTGDRWCRNGAYPTKGIDTLPLHRNQLKL